MWELNVLDPFSQLHKTLLPYIPLCGDRRPPFQGKNTDFKTMEDDWDPPYKKKRICLDIYFLGVLGRPPPNRSRPRKTWISHMIAGVHLDLAGGRVGPRQKRSCHIHFSGVIL